ncbi:MAG: HAMP domain-containing histidine kinase [Lachnospiraceae bacterium]|nr:HAMP domain-containing histidine kinase [Lachnospiraceae bacterium]
MWIAVSIAFAVLCAGLLVKIALMKRAMRQIADEFGARMRDESDTSVGSPDRDKDLCRLVDVLNRELHTMRATERACGKSLTDLNRAVANLSHDLRTPLTAIGGYLTLLSETDDPAEREQYLKVLGERTAVMRQLTEELLQYSVIVSDDHTQDTEELSINTVLAESIAGAYPMLTERGIAPEVTLPDTPVIRKANRTELSRMFANLLTNAVRYSDGDLSVTLAVNGDVTFANAASGLDPVLAGQLFDRFFTVETGAKGVGLGLSIVRTLAERMGGSAEAKYTDGRLEVTVHLPE